MPKDTKKEKPDKPYPDFPLFAHARKRWAKKIRGRTFYFGPWNDPDGALQLYLDQRDDLHAGRAPRVVRDGLTVHHLLNRFLEAKEARLDSGEIQPRTFTEYRDTADRIADAFGLSRLVENLAADDFEHLRRNMARKWGPVRLGNEVVRIRGVFKYGHDIGLFDKPIRFGPGFAKPSQKVIRQARAKAGKKLFEPVDLRAVIKGAPVPLKAMILLGINCAFGNTDVATLPRDAVDLERGWIDYPRPKTGIPRPCPLWKETVAAVRKSLTDRPEPKDKAHADLMFITQQGLSFAAGMSHWRVAGETAKLLKKLKVKRPGLSFYALRHTFATIGGEAGDEVAVRAIMGHASASTDMGATYRQRVTDDRLRAVVGHVHQWLFGKSV